MTAVVLGLTHGGLATARSLSKRGVTVIGATYEGDEFGTASSHLSDLVICPHPQDHEAFVEFLCERAAAWSGAMLFDTNDHFLDVLSRHKKQLGTHYRIASPDRSVVHHFLDKQQTYRLAAEHGIPHPRIVDPGEPVDGTLAFDERALDGLQFPLMLKPTRSHEFVAVFGAKNFVVNDTEELRAGLGRTAEAGQHVILSEIVPGTDNGTLERIHLYLDQSGGVAAAFSNVKLRQTPPMFGVMRVGRSTPPNAEVEELALRLLRAVDYRGFASVEFKRDHRDGQLKLMEVNMRVPRSMPLPIRAGVDFPWLMYQDLVAGNRHRVDDYHHETYLIELPTDVIDLVRYDRQRIRGMRAFVGPYLARRRTFGIPERGDMRPFVKALRTRSRTGMRTLGSSATGRP